MLELSGLMIRLTSALALALLLPAGAGAGAEEAKPPPTGASDRSVPRVIPIFGLQYSCLLGLAGSLGVGVGREEPKDSWRGLVAVVEPGGGGIKLLAGVGAVEGNSGALFARASFLRTWREPGGVSPDQSYAGAELEGMLLGFNAMVGLYRHVGGLRGEPDWLWTAGVGLWH